MSRLRSILVFELLLLVLGGSAGAAAPAPGLTVAAAADLNFALTDIAARFQKQTGVKVRLTFGSSGNIFTQIQNGAPFDLFFSADMEYPRKLEKGGFAAPGSVVRYAVGRLVLWVPENSSLALNHLGMKSLIDPSVQRVSIANPVHAPYGRAAVEALRHLGLYNQVAPKLVIGENVSQAAQFVQSGNAQVGVIALSLALAPAMKGHYWEIATNAYSALEQGAIVLKNSQNQTLARQFLDFMKTPESTQVLRRYGFTVESR